MLTTQIIEEYVQGQPLMTRELFSVLLSSKNPITKQFLSRYMDALKEKLQEVRVWSKVVGGEGKLRRE